MPRNKQQQDIRDNVNLDDGTKQGLDDADPRDAIGSGRGVAWQSGRNGGAISSRASGGGAAGGGGAPEEEEENPDEEAPIPEQPPGGEGGNDPTDEGESSPNDPNTPSGEQDDKVTDVSDVIDIAEILCTITGTCGVGEGVKIGDKLKGITGITNCDTGECIKIRLDGTYTPITGTNGGADWPDAATPPDVNGWEEGTFWRIELGPPPGIDMQYPNDNAAIDSGLFFALGGSTQVSGSVVGSQWELTPSGPYFLVTDYFLASAGTYVAEAVETDEFYAGELGPRSNVMAVVQKDCLTGGPTITCVDESPTEDEQPSDGCVEYALIDGKFQANSLDPDATADDLQEKSVLHGNSGAGTFSIGVLQQSAGFFVGKTVTCGGALIASGVIALFDGNGELFGFTDPGGLVNY